MATTNDLKNGIVLNIEGQLWTVVGFQHVKPGKGPAFVRTTLKHVLTGKQVDRTFNAGLKVETATVDRRDMTYLYNDGSDYVFMDKDSYDQLNVPGDVVGNAANFLLENTDAMVATHEGTVLFVELPVSVELVIQHTDPGRAGRSVLRRHQAGHPGDRRRGPGAAVRQHRRQDQGRHPRRPLPRSGQRLSPALGDCPSPQDEP